MFFKTNSYKKVYTDGAINRELGISGLGAVFFNDNDRLIKAIYRACPLATNNEAEYKAVILALKYALNKRFYHLKVYSDSQIVVHQALGLASVKSLGLKYLHHELALLLASFNEIDFIHIPRWKNQIADAFANQAIHDYRQKEVHEKQI